MNIKSFSHEFWIGALLLFISLLAYFIIIPEQVGGEIQRGVAPTFFPRLSAVWVGFFSLLILIRSLLSVEKNPHTMPSPIETRAGRKGAILTILGSILYLVLCSLVSYIVSTLLILVLLTWTLGERRWYLIILATLVTTFGIYFLFGKVMSVQLPEGVLF